MKFTLENYLNNDIRELLVIYPGRFQPAHKNHAKVYNFLLNQFPRASVFISTSNKIDLPNSPFTFEEKKMMLVASGIPEQAIIQTTNPYVAREITNKFSPENTSLIFAVGGKDMEDTTDKQTGKIIKPRFNFLPTKKGEPYFKPLSNLKKITDKQVKYLDTFNLHGYVSATPTFNFTLNISGKKINIKSASDIRNMYRNASEAGRKIIITQLYNNFNPQIYDLFNKRLF